MDISDASINILQKVGKRKICVFLARIGTLL